MTENILDLLLFAVLPYAALLLMFVGTTVRYLKFSFSYSSLSSQFLENKHHFWAVVPFHYGILVILLGHLIGFLIPRSVLAWNSVPLRLYVLEVSALVFGILTLVGLLGIVLRRHSDHKVRAITSPTDWVLYALLILQVLSGLSVSIFYGWGSSWYAATAVPYLWSLFMLTPDLAALTAMPLLVKLHIAGAFLLIAWFPFTRLVHVLVIPNHYFFRRPQVVRWYGIRRLLAGRDDAAGISSSANQSDRRKG
ncbi:MAG: respiratory nitrate reductase subunit gamma [Bacteroidota bacterium]